MPDLPVAVPDPADLLKAAEGAKHPIPWYGRQWIEDRIGGNRADAEFIAAATPDRILALLAERQQDKERIKNVEDIARAGISWAPPDHKRQLTERLDAALAVEEDATE